MSDPRTSIFDAIRNVRGSPILVHEIPYIHDLCDRLQLPKEGALCKIQNPKKFFDSVKARFGPLNQVQVNTLNSILDNAGHWPVGFVAYGMATAWGECKLKPIEEIGKGRGRKYSVAGARSDGTIGNRYGGQIPYGRGLVQLTWCDNYEWADEECAKAGLTKKGEILADFSLVLRPDIAAFILIRGMETGAFTGKKLSHYISDRGTLEGFKSSRRIINGTDKAAQFADYALSFRVAIDAGVWK